MSLLLAYTIAPADPANAVTLPVESDCSVILEFEPRPAAPALHVSVNGQPTENSISTLYGEPGANTGSCAIRHASDGQGMVTMHLTAPLTVGEFRCLGPTFSTPPVVVMQAEAWTGYGSTSAIVRWRPLTPGKECPDADATSRAP